MHQVKVNSMLRDHGVVAFKNEYGPEGLSQRMTNRFQLSGHFQTIDNRHPPSSRCSYVKKV